MNRAYPAAAAANNPVKKTVAPSPAYLDFSVGHLTRSDKSAPEQTRKKFEM
jgi:hypothetical protein